jgi:transcriptional regulator
MYTPSKFSVSNDQMIRSFIEQNSFAIVISHDGTQFHDTHTPLLISNDLKMLSGHIARANPQWKKWKEQSEVKVIFHGPHAYVSPRYYKTSFNVPTWNYSAVSIDGKIQLIEAPDKTLALIKRLVTQYEGIDGWKLDSSDEKYTKLFDAIICFEIQIEKIETKFKLSQNKTIEDQLGVIQNLEKSSFSSERDIAALMKMNLEKLKT